MPTPRPRGLFGPRFAKDLWRLTRIYWTSPDAPMGALLLAIAITLELATVQASVAIAGAEGRIFDALGDRDTTSFFTAMLGFLGVIALFVLASTYRLWVRARLEIRWREGVTRRFLEEWMGPEAFCQATLHPEGLDNPDQRIAQDVGTYVASALGLSLSLLSAIATLYSFGSILWRMSQAWPIHVGGTEIWVPGLMLWVAIGYAVLATFITHLIGRQLVPINFDRLRVEADFRYGLVHFRDNVEAVSLARGQDCERRVARGRFGYVVRNFLDLIAAQRRLTLFTAGIGQVNSLIPILIGAPAYFARHLTLGNLAETRIAYGQFSSALAWFVNAYQEIAQWRASIERLSTFLDAVDATRTRLACGTGLQVEPSPDGTLHLFDTRLDTPTGRALLHSATGSIRAGDRVNVTGPAGTGKTTLLRAIAGLWPFGDGRIQVPAPERSMFVSQNPYLPLGTLATALAYPAPPETFSHERLLEVLHEVGLDRLAPQLDSEQPWEHTLSGEERQRIVFARVLLHRPEWIFADDATMGLDESTERRVVSFVRKRLPQTTIVAVTQRPGALGPGERNWTMTSAPDGAATLDAA